MSRLAAVLGVIGGAAWIGLGFYPPECTPVTGASEVFCNRLWTAPLAAMSASAALALAGPLRATGRAARAGGAAMAIALGLMAAGNGGEYWLAYQLPHEGPDGAIRGVLWMTVLAGWLGTLLAATALGAALLRSKAGPVRPGWGLVLAIPLTVALGLAGQPTIAIGVAGISVGVVHLAGTR